MTGADLDPISELFLTVECDEAAAGRLAAALEVHAVASVLLLPPATAALSVVRPLIAIAQAAGAATLIHKDAGLALSTMSDGVHLPHTKDATSEYRAARGMLGSRLIVGADAGPTRHSAMVLAESGADYIGFGLDGEEGSVAVGRRLERIVWWAEIFEVPCVALEVETAEEAEALAGAGADFIGITLRAGEDASVAAQRVGQIANALAAAGFL